MSASSLPLVVRLAERCAVESTGLHSSIPMSARRRPISPCGELRGGLARLWEDAGIAASLIRGAIRESKYAGPPPETLALLEELRRVLDQLLVTPDEDGDDDGEDS